MTITAQQTSLAKLFEQLRAEINNGQTCEARGVADECEAIATELLEASKALVASAFILWFTPQTGSGPAATTTWAIALQNTDTNLQRTCAAVRAAQGSN